MDEDISFPWTEEFRPKTIEEIIGDEQLLGKINEYIQTKSIPNLLFSGPAGTGKTTIAKMLAKIICGEDNYLNINASERNNIDTIRTDVLNYCSMSSFNDSIKIIILDEFDGMTVQAQRSLKAVMEDFAKTTRFILTTNHENRIIDAIKSRCTKFSFAGSSKASIAKKCFEILGKKKIKAKDSKESMIEGVKGIVNSYYPDIRLTINTLQQFSKNGEFSYNEAAKNDAIEENLIKYIKEGKIRNIREEILNSNVDYKLLYDIIFDNIKQLTEKQEKIGGLIILVSEYMYRHPTHLNSEINFVACLVEIVNLLKDL